MKKIFTLTLLLIFALTSAVFAAEERVPTISVNGEGVVETSPDRATISVGVTNRDKDAAKVQTENARIATNIIRSVTALGVERSNIHTGNYSFHRYYKQQDNRRLPAGYEVNNTVTIIVDDLNLVGKVIDVSLSSGANEVGSLQFGVRDKSNLQVEAIRLAVQDARRKAEVAAAALGKSIVSVKSVSINSGSISTPRFQKFAMAMEDADVNYETPVESGTLICSMSVHVDFEISR